MKVLVIGGTGWVGHNIALACSRAGFDTTVMSRNPDTRFADQVSFLPRVTGSKTNREFMYDVLKSGNYDCIIDSVPSPEAIDILTEFNQLYDRYIQCGSVGVYTPLQYIPADEEHLWGHAKYDGFQGKVAADMAMFAAVDAGNLRGTVLRPSCIAGPGKLPLDNIGGRREDFISDIMTGKTLDLLDGGNALLQIVHVRDLGRAFALAAGNPASVGQAYNICGRNAVTVRKYCELNAAALDKEVTFENHSFDELIAKHGEDIRGGLTFLAEHMCFEIGKAEYELGWEPEYSVPAAVAETAREAAGKGRL
ncbi:MAG: NAD-dependent epimerase/dehydratase family protein [Lentisphaerae bacterium]|nr:NAD-dependent epimerase/dehydratase family protein [Lentisphaerota bacterium]